MKTGWKKVLSVAAAAVLLVSMLAIGGIFVSAEEQTDDAHLIANFTSKAQFEKFTADATMSLTGRGANSQAHSMAYDEEAGAVKFTIVNGKIEDPGRADEFWMFLTGAQIGVKGNQTIVLKTKKNNAGMAAYAVTVAVNNVPISVNPTYEDAGDGWQYMILSLSDASIEGVLAGASIDDAVYGTIRVPFNGSTYYKDDTFHVAWVGAFADLDEAKDFEKAMGIVGANELANFTTKAKYDNFTSLGAATSFSFARQTPEYGFDAANGAATFKTTQGKDNDPTRQAEFWLFLNGLSGVKVKGNETIVLKVKRSNTDMAPYATTAYVNGTPVDVTPTFTDAGDGWQYLALTAASSAIIAKVGQDGYDTGEWTTIRIPFNGGTYSSGDTFSVAWAGAFASLDDAKLYDEYQGGISIDETAPADTFIDFTKKEKYDAWKAKADAVGNDKVEYLHANGTMAYDETVGAAVYAPNADGSQLRIGLADGTGTAKMSENTVIAFKIKVSNPTAIVGWNTVYTSSVNWRAVAKNVQVNTSPSTDWRLYIVNVAKDQLSADHAAVYDTDNWAGGDIWFNGTNMKAGDKVWVAWMGAFADAAAAAEYFDKTTKITESPLLFDFSTQEKYNANVTKIENKENFADPAFDEEAKALKLTVSKSGWSDDPAIGKQYQKFNLYDGASTDRLSKNTLLAFKVKFSNTGTKLGHQVARNNKLNWVGVTLKDGPTESDKWQLITIDVSKEALLAHNQAKQLIETAGCYYDIDTWAGMGLWLSGATTAVGDTMHVAWAGAFANEAEALAYYKSTTPEAIPDLPVYDDEKIPPYFWHFDSAITVEALVDRGKVNAQNATLAYNAELDGLTITPTPGLAGVERNFTVAPREELTVSVDDYPVVAFRVKLNNKNNTLADVMWSTEDDEASSWNGMFGNIQNGSGNQAPKDIGMKYRATEDWQIVVIDGSNINDGVTWPQREYTNAWEKGLLLKLMDNAVKASEDQIITIDWIGAFPTVDSVYEYAGEEKPDPDGKEDPSGFFYKFESAAHLMSVNVANNENDGNTAISYDAEQDAMKITISRPIVSTDRSNPAKFHIGAGANVSTEEYPVFAMRVKLSDADLKFGTMLMRTTAYQEAYEQAGGQGMTWWTDMPGVNIAYEKTTDWQVVVVDGTMLTTPHFAGDWLGALLALMPTNGSGVTADSAVWVDWLGAFPSVQAVYDYADILPPDSDAPTLLFWDLSDEEVINQQVSVYGDTAFEYSEEFEALKIMAKDTNNDGALSSTPGRLQLGIKTPVAVNAAAADYPIMAIRVKLGNAALTGDFAHFRTTETIQAALDGMLNSSDFEVDLLNYDATENWQTIVIDCTADPTSEFYFQGNWKAMIFDLLTNALNDDTVYVRWAGAFASEQDVLDYVAKTKGDEIGNVEEEGDDDQDTDDDDTTNPDTGENSIAVVVAVLLTLAGAALVVSRKKAHN